MDAHTIGIRIVHRPVSLRHRERFTVDFLIDDASLARRLQSPLRGTVGRFDTPFSKPWADEDVLESWNRRAMAAFLAEEPDFRDGRVLFYVCPDCGSPKCVAVSGLILRTGDRYRWSDFRFDDPSSPLLSGTIDVGPFEFEAGRYEELIRQLGRVAPPVHSLP